MALRVLPAETRLTVYRRHRVWITTCQFYKIPHIDFGFAYFSHNKLDEPDLNLVSIFDFYHFKSLKSIRQSSLRCGENYVKNDKFMESFATPRNDPA